MGEPLIDLRSAGAGRKPRRNSSNTGGPSSSYKARRKNRTDDDELTYCPATVKHGKRQGESCNMLCPVVRIKGKRYKLKTCTAHASPAIRRALGMQGGSKPGAGRPKIKTPHEVLKERLEADIERYLKPYEEALKAIKPIVVGNGAHARVVEYADANARMAAVNSLLDRVYGKPKQINEFSGPGGEAIEVKVPDDKERQLSVAQVLAEVGALGPVMAVPENASASAPSNN